MCVPNEEHPDQVGIVALAAIPRTQEHLTGSIQGLRRAEETLNRQAGQQQLETGPLRVPPSRSSNCHSVIDKTLRTSCSSFCEEIDCECSTSTHRPKGGCLHFANPQCFFHRRARN